MPSRLRGRGQRPPGVCLREACVGSRVHALYKSRHGYTKRPGNAQEAQDAGVADTALDATDVGGVKLGKFAEFLLGELALFPLAAEVLAQSF